MNAFPDAVHKCEFRVIVSECLLTIRCEVERKEDDLGVWHTLLDHLYLLCPELLETRRKLRADLLQPRLLSLDHVSRTLSNALQRKEGKTSRDKRDRATSRAAVGQRG